VNSTIVKLLVTVEIVLRVYALLMSIGVCKCAFRVEVQSLFALLHRVLLVLIKIEWYLCKQDSRVVLANVETLVTLAALVV